MMTRRFPPVRIGFVLSSEERRRLAVFVSLLVAIDRRRSRLRRRIITTEKDEEKSKKSRKTRLEYENIGSQFCGPIFFTDQEVIR